ncbi:hypothetical protein BDR06DRAFT_885947 [Suillus hirtellus]|nr:hypothetical protein BDR06DRAFT_885947 [Suillus hirtellus]
MLSSVILCLTFSHCYRSDHGRQEVPGISSTLLNHERRGPAGTHFHPKSFAYGRLEHFEYLAVQLLGMNVDEVRAPCPLPAVVGTLVVADQMISALEHIQKNKLVHCDPKTGNIFIHPTDFRYLYLVD